MNIATILVLSRNRPGLTCCALISDMHDLHVFCNVTKRHARSDTVNGTHGRLSLCEPSATVIVAWDAVEVSVCESLLKPRLKHLRTHTL